MKIHSISIRMYVELLVTDMTSPEDYTEPKIEDDFKGGIRA